MQNNDIMELYNEHEKYIDITINKRFSSSSFLSAHGLTKDDLKQYGRIGLFNACTTYDKSKGTSFRNYAIENIAYSILNESKNDSLGNIHKRTNELIDKTSMDKIYKDELGGEYSLHDIVESEELGYEQTEIDEFLDCVSTVISKEVEEIIKMRMEGYTFQEIGDKFGVSRQAIQKKLKSHRNAIKEMVNNI